MKISRFSALLLALALLLSSVGLAAQEIDPDRALSIRIEYAPGSAAASGILFELYRVAAADENGGLSMLSPFDNYGIDLNSGSEEQLAGLAQTLQGYVLQDDIDPDFSGYTDASGSLRFSGGLRQGLYLLLGSRHRANGLIYTPQPVLLQLPSRDPISGEWNYELALKMKYDTETDTDEPLRLKVLKVWDDEGHEDRRPYILVVHLLCDGRVYDTVDLTSGNNWRYTWENLEPDHQWNVTEELVFDYSHTITREGITFVITNTFQTPQPTATPTPQPTATPTPQPTATPGIIVPTPTPGTDEPTPTPGVDEPTPTPGTDEPTPTPTPESSATPTPEPTPTPDIDEPTPTPGTDEPTPTPGADEPTPTPDIDEPTPTPGADEPTPTPQVTEKPDKPDDPKLPQTGQYWWPVPMLIAIGLLLIILGLIRRRGSDYEE